jgi:hypothetical protein
MAILARRHRFDVPFAPQPAEKNRLSHRQIAAKSERKDGRSHLDTARISLVPQ